VQRIEDWLASLGLSEYTDRFAENRVDVGVLHDLSDEDLKELGIPFGHRKKILRAVAGLKGVAPKAAAAAPGERRQLTVMFCDLVGSTELSARLDPEDLTSVIAAYRAVCKSIISTYEGHVAQFLGDGLLVYFGFPQAHENDAERAIRAGLEIVAAIPSIETGIREPLRVRAGIATGLVVFGDLIFDGPEGHTAVGDTPNLAARLQEVAAPGTVVISASTRQLATGHFDYRELGPMALKGLPEKMGVWQVLGLSKVESRFEAEHGNSLPPLLGRQEEIDLIHRRWRQAAQGEGCVVLLTGEAGIGKSHIVLAFQESLQTEPHICLRYFCSSHHTNSALFPFVAQFERAAEFERGETPEQKLAKLEAMLKQATKSSTDVALLANLLSLPLDDRFPLPDVSAQKRKEMTLLALLGQLQGLAKLRPVLVVFEDAHWVDPTSLELLTLTVQRVPQLPMLLLITARPEFIPPWPNHAHVTTQALTRLSRRYGAALVDRVAAGKTLPDQVLEKILAQTDGVPLFIEELTKTLLESGLLQERGGSFVLDHPLPPLAVPTTLYASLMARLDRLGHAKEVAQIGAAIGREFSYELLSMVSGFEEQALETALDQLAKAELVFCRGEKLERIYMFKHVLVRDAAYAGLLKGRRAELHAAIANTLEQKFGETVDSEPEILAHHLTEAGLSRKAVEYWFQAGKRAAARSANVEAIAHLERGLEVASRLREDDGRDRLELDLRFALAPCLIATQGPASALATATFTRALQLCQRQSNAPEYLQVMFWLVTASVIRGELPQALEEIATLEHLAETRDDQAALLNAMRGRAMILLFMGRIDHANEEIKAAIKKFDTSDETVRQRARAAGQDAKAAALALMSWSLWLLGEVENADTQITAALERAKLVEHPHTLAYVSYYASILYALRGDTETALQHAEHCLALSDMHGFKQWRNLARAVRGISLTMLNRASDIFALDEVKGALNEYRREGYALGITALDVLWCPALLLRNNVEAALDVIDQGLATADRNAERLFEAELYRLKARTISARDAAEGQVAALPLLEHALRTAKAQNARSLEIRIVKDLARLLQSQGNNAGAIALLTRYGSMPASGEISHSSL